MEPAAAAQRISELTLIAGLPESARQQVAEVFIHVSDIIGYSNGHPLISAGYLAFDTGYVLLDGQVLVERPEQDGIEVKAPALLGEMAQFSSADIRSATVRAVGNTTAAQFYWEDLYNAAEQELPEAAALAFRNAIERQTWERFEYKHIADMPLFSGLDTDLKTKVCLPFPTIGERIRLREVDTLFNEGAACQATGYLLVRGKFRLYRKDAGEKILEAPDVIGIFPSSGDYSANWSATGMANGEAEILRFSWIKYMSQILKRLKHDEFQAFVKNLQQNAGKHFRR